jgi:hypothetical protein
MYTLVNGTRKPVNFGFDNVKEGFANDDTPVATGSNKIWLIIALVVSLLAVGASSYLLYKHISAESKNRQGVGYRLM